MGNILDKLKNNLEEIVDSPELIHNQNFMMVMLTQQEGELHEFQEQCRDFIEEQETFHFNALGKEKAYHMTDLMNELLSLKYHDNRGTTPTLEELAAVMEQPWINTLIDQEKTT